VKQALLCRGLQRFERTRRSSAKIEVFQEGRGAKAPAEAAGKAAVRSAGTPKRWRRPRCVSLIRDFYEEGSSLTGSSVERALLCSGLQRFENRGGALPKFGVSGGPRCVRPVRPGAGGRRGAFGGNALRRRLLPDTGLL
jgi:hypothetical protein